MSRKPALAIAPTPFPKKTYLSRVDNRRLETLIIEQFPLMAMSDGQFAAFAREQLGVQGINGNHIVSARQAFGIPGTRVAKPKVTKATMAERLAALERRLDALCEKLGETI
jgi:hypothetical protein